VWVNPVMVKSLDAMFGSLGWAEVLNEELEDGTSRRPCHRSQVLVDLVFGMAQVGNVAWAM